MTDLILYLEPRATTTLRVLIETVFAECRRDFPCEAFRYPPHVSMVGFFGSSGHANQVLDYLDQKITAATRQCRSDGQGSRQIISNLANSNMNKSDDDNTSPVGEDDGQESAKREELRRREASFIKAAENIRDADGLTHKDKTRDRNIMVNKDTQVQRQEQHEQQIHNQQLQEERLLLVSNDITVTGTVRPRPEMLLLDIKVTEPFFNLVKGLCINFPELGIRPKKINHLSVAYWIDEELDKSDAAVRKRLARVNKIEADSVKWNFLQGSTTLWDIVLYESECRQRYQTLDPYVLRELRRWPLPREEIN